MEPRVTFLLTTIAAFLLSDIYVHGRTQEIDGSISPDARFRVVVSERGGKIAYEIVANRAATVLRQIPSSYQPMEDELPDWSWRHATAAGVKWSPDSHYVVIDEQVHNYIGDVFITEITGDSARAVSLPVQGIVARLGSDWERYRIRVERGWLSSRELSLVLAGRVITGVLPDGRWTLAHRSVEIVLQVGNGRATLKGFGEITNRNLKN